MMLWVRNLAVLNWFLCSSCYQLRLLSGIQLVDGPVWRAPDGFLQMSGSDSCKARLCWDCWLEFCTWTLQHGDLMIVTTLISWLVSLKVSISRGLESYKVYYFLASEFQNTTSTTIYWLRKSLSPVLNEGKKNSVGGVTKKKPFFKKLKYSWFTILCQSLLHNKVTQLYAYVHSFLYSFPLWFIIGY